MRALATWCVRHRRLVVLFWVVALVVVSAIEAGVGSNYSNNFSLPKTESTEALQLLQAASPKVAGDREQVVIATSGGRKVTDPAVEARVTAMLGRLKAVPHVTTVLSPYGPGGAEQISKSGTVAFAVVTFDRLAQSITNAEARHFVAVARSADGPGVQVAVSGQVAEASNKQSIGGTGPGIILAGVVLLLVFGSFFAMLLPLVSALASLGTAVGLIGLLSNVLTMPNFSTELTLLIGLGVGVDYALFIVTRHRQGMMAGHDVESSIVHAVNTSGRAVLFAGIIVCIALLGMVALGVSFLYGLAVAAALGVALTMLAALTLLPALLGFLGPRAISRRYRRRLAEHGPRVSGSGSTGFWARWADVVRARPAIPAVVATALIVVVALPFFSMRLGSTDQGSDPIGTTTRTAYDLLAKGFGPGFNGPLELVSVVHGPADRAALGRLVGDVRHERGVATVGPPVLIPTKAGGDVALLVAYPTSSPQAAATTQLIHRLRTTVIPRAVAGSHLAVYVGGTTAIFVDFANVLSGKFPVFIALVVVLAFLLLAMVFRSLVVPLTAAVMNILSIGAAFGSVVAVFQWGWLDSLFGVSKTGPVESFLPVMMFAILFGLSMDYQVFLVTRIHEEYLHGGGDAKAAVRNGLAATGQTISAAALIMILVFGSFVLGGIVVIKEFGVGLAGGILMDALVIRMAIVPAVMQLLGRSSWWFPGWLDRVLPRIGIEPPEADEEAIGFAGEELDGFGSEIDPGA